MIIQYSSEYPVLSLFTLTYDTYYWVFQQSLLAWSEIFLSQLYWVSCLDVCRLFCIVWSCNISLFLVYIYFHIWPSCCLVDRGWTLVSEYRDFCWFFWHVRLERRFVFPVFYLVLQRWTGLCVLFLYSTLWLSIKVSLRWWLWIQGIFPRSW